MKNVLKTVGLMGLMALPVLAQGARQVVAPAKANKVVVAAKPADAKPADVKATEVKPAEMKAAETKPSAAGKTGEMKAEVKPEARPAVVAEAPAPAADAGTATPAPEAKKKAPGKPAPAPTK